MPCTFSFDSTLFSRHIPVNMRCKSILAAAILSLATARAEVVDDINDAAGEASSSVSSAVDSAASAASSSGAARPQFTVSLVISF